MKFFHVRGEADVRLPGFNFYPWSERRNSIGFTFLFTWGDRRTLTFFRFRPRFRDFIITKKSWSHSEVTAVFNAYLSDNNTYSNDSSNRPHLQEAGL